METLRCQSPRVLHQELEMYFIADNLLRALMVAAAALAEVVLEQLTTPRCGSRVGRAWS